MQQQHKHKEREGEEEKEKSQILWLQSNVINTLSTGISYISSSMTCNVIQLEHYY